MKAIIITKKIWNKKNFKNLNNEIFLLNKINYSKIKKLKPDIIFFIHWSKKIKKFIFDKYLCIQFHCSALPKGRGGSPIQNQILLNKKQTRLTAFKVTEKIDEGDICAQINLSLKGNLYEILSRIEKQSLNIIKKLLKKKKIKFSKQKGIPTYFKRRKSIDSKLKFNRIKNFKMLYDHIRMLDAEGYPAAYIQTNKFKIMFKNVKKSKKFLIANALIKKNEK